MSDHVHITGAGRRLPAGPAACQIRQQRTCEGVAAGGVPPAWAKGDSRLRSPAWACTPGLPRCRSGCAPAGAAGGVGPGCSVSACRSCLLGGLSQASSHGGTAGNAAPVRAPCSACCTSHPDARGAPTGRPKRCAGTLNGAGFSSFCSSEGLTSRRATTGAAPLVWRAGCTQCPGVKNADKRSGLAPCSRVQAGRSPDLTHLAHPAAPCWPPWRPGSAAQHTACC